MEEQQASRQRKSMLQRGDPGEMAPLHQIRTPIREPHERWGWGGAGGGSHGGVEGNPHLDLREEEGGPPLPPLPSSRPSSRVRAAVGDSHGGTELWRTQCGGAAVSAAWRAAVIATRVPAQICGRRVATLSLPSSRPSRRMRSSSGPQSSGTALCEGEGWQPRRRGERRPQY